MSLASPEPVHSFDMDRLSPFQGRFRAPDTNSHFKNTKALSDELLQRRDRRRLTRTASLSQADFVKPVFAREEFAFAIKNANEPQRLAALHRMNILDTPADENFDRIASLAQSIFGVKIALITLVDAHRHWRKSALGVDDKFAICNEFSSYAMQGSGVTVVPDTHASTRFAKHPMVVNSPFLRFYAGAPMRSTDGYNLGIFSIADDLPHTDFDITKQQQLIDLAAIVVREMELARQNQASSKISARQQIVAAMSNQSDVTSLDELYEINCVRIAEVLDVDYVQILEFSEDKQHFIMRSGFGWNASAKNSVRDFKSLVNQVLPQLNLPNPGTYIIENMDDVLPPHVGNNSPGLLETHCVKSGMCSILYHKDKPFGMIGIFDEESHAWLHEDVMFLTECAKALSVLIERTQHALELAHEKQRADELLYTILPFPISQRLKTSEDLIADAHSSVTILFADIVNFTQVSTLVTPKELVSFLNKVFSTFDIETLTRGLEKIKIIGDCYMVAGGLFSHENDHAESVVELACDLLIALNLLLKEEYADHPHFANVNVRIGINTGPVVAGVIGLDRFLYDVWGDSVNTASRLEATGLPGQIHISEATMASIAHKDKFLFDARGSIYLKGKGEMQTLFVRRKHACSAG